MSRARCISNYAKSVLTSIFSRPPYASSVTVPLVLTVPFLYACAQPRTALCEKTEAKSAEQQLTDALLLIQNRKFNEAEVQLLKVLKKAEAEGDCEQLVNIYSILADAYILDHEYKKAEEILKKVQSRLKSVEGYDDGHPFIITIALKIADAIYERGKTEDAETRYFHCHQEMLKKFRGHQTLKHEVLRPSLALSDEEIQGLWHLRHRRNELELYLSVADAYSTCLATNKKLIHALVYMEEALLLSRALYGTKSCFTMLQLSKLGAMNTKAGNNEVAFKSLGEAIGLAQNTPQCAFLIPEILFNYAEALAADNRNEEARIVARRSLEIAKQTGDTKVPDRVNELLKRLDYKTALAGQKY